jgi:hypothetical protein
VAYYRLDEWSLVPNMGKDSSSHRFIKTGCGIDPASCPVDTGGSLHRIKRLEHEVHHLPPSCAEFKNCFCCTSTVLYMKSTCYLLGCDTI